MSHVRIGGTWREFDKVWVNVGGTWQEVDKIFTNIGGVWKEGWSDYAVPAIFIAGGSGTTSGRVYRLYIDGSGQEWSHSRSVRSFAVNQNLESIVGEAQGDVSLISPTGVYRYTSSTGTNTVVNNIATNPSNIFASTQSTIHKWSADLNYTTKEQIFTSSRNIRHMAVLNDGTLYLSTQTSSGTSYIERISPSGTREWYSIISNYGYSEGMATDKNGNCIILNRDTDNKGRISKYTPTETTPVWVKDSIVPYYTKIAIDGNDYMYVIEYGQGFIIKLDPNGNVVWRKTTGLKTNNGGIAVDKKGFVYYVSSDDNGRVVKFTPNGDIMWTTASGVIIPYHTIVVEPMLVGANPTEWM